MRRGPIWGAVVVLGLFAASWFTARQTCQLARATEAANRERLAEQPRIRRAVDRRREVLEEISVAERELASQKRALLLPKTENSHELPQRVPTIAERLRTEPDAQILWLNLQRSWIATTYGPLFRKLGLLPEQIARSEQNMIHKEEMKMDLQAISTEQRKNSGSVSRETTELLKHVEVEYANAQKEALGEANFQQVQDYERTTRVRRWVDGWAGGAPIYLGEPLTPQQGEQIVHIMANAIDNYRRGAAAYGPVNWSAVETAARPILTQNQFRFLTTTEPPLPYGGRFQAELYERVLKASQSEPKPAREK